MLLKIKDVGLSWFKFRSKIGSKKSNTSNTFLSGSIGGGILILVYIFENVNMFFRKK